MWQMGRVRLVLEQERKSRRPRLHLLALAEELGTVVLQARVPHLLDHPTGSIERSPSFGARQGRQPLRQPRRRVGLLPDADLERPKRPEQEPRVEAANVGADVGPVVPQVVPCLFRLDADGPDQGVRVTGKVLCARVHDNVGAPLERVLQRRRTERRVDPERRVGGFGPLRVCRWRRSTSVGQSDIFLWRRLRSSVLTRTPCDPQCAIERDSPVGFNGVSSQTSVFLCFGYSSSRPITVYIAFSISSPSIATFARSEIIASTHDGRFDLAVDFERRVAAVVAVRDGDDVGLHVQEAGEEGGDARGVDKGRLANNTRQDAFDARQGRLRVAVRSRTKEYRSAHAFVPWGRTVTA